MERYLELANVPNAAVVALKFEDEEITLSDLAALTETNLQDLGFEKIGPRMRLIKYIKDHPPSSTNLPVSTKEGVVENSFGTSTELFYKNEKLTSSEFMKIFNEYESDGQIPHENVDVFASELSRARSGDNAVAKEKAESMARVLRKRHSTTSGGISMSAMESVLEVEECFFLNLKKKHSRISSTDFFQIWQHYDTDMNGFIQSNELEAFLRDLMIEKKTKELIPITPTTTTNASKDNTTTAHKTNTNKTKHNTANTTNKTNNNTNHDTNDDTNGDDDGNSNNTINNTITVTNNHNRNHTNTKTNHDNGIKSMSEATTTPTKPKGEIKINGADVKDYCKTLLELYDSDGDGKLSIGELSCVLSVENNFLDKLKGRTELTKKQFDKVFQHYDRDNCGIIEGPKLKALAWDELRSFDDVMRIDMNAVNACEAAMLAECGATKENGMSPEQLAKLLELSHLFQ